MVRKTHCYADGGKVDHDHTYDTDYREPAPRYRDAFVDRVKALFTSGMAGKAAKQVSGSKDGARKRQIDKAVEDMSG